MKQVFVGVLLWWIFSMSSQSFAASRETRWKAVDDAVAKGLPQTAITNLEPIITEALAGHAYAEAGKAIARKIVLEGTIQETSRKKKFGAWRSPITNAPAELSPVLRSILAQLGIGTISKTIGGDSSIALPPGRRRARISPRGPCRKLFTEIDRQFTLALSGADALRAIPIAHSMR